MAHPLDPASNRALRQTLLGGVDDSPYGPAKPSGRPVYKQSNFAQVPFQPIRQTPRTQQQEYVRRMQSGESLVSRVGPFYQAHSAPVRQHPMERPPPQRLQPTMRQSPPRERFAPPPQLREQRVPPMQPRTGPTHMPVQTRMAPPQVSVQQRFAPPPVPTPQRMAPSFVPPPQPRMAPPTMPQPQQAKRIPPQPPLQYLPQPQRREPLGPETLVWRPPMPNREAPPLVQPQDQQPRLPVMPFRAYRPPEQVRNAYEMQTLPPQDSRHGQQDPRRVLQQDQRYSPPRQAPLRYEGPSQPNPNFPVTSVPRKNVGGAPFAYGNPAFGLSSGSTLAPPPPPAEVLARKAQTSAMPVRAPNPDSLPAFAAPPPSNMVAVANPSRPHVQTYTMPERPKPVRVMQAVAPWAGAGNAVVNMGAQAGTVGAEFSRMGARTAPTLASPVFPMDEGPRKLRKRGGPPSPKSTPASSGNSRSRLVQDSHAFEPPRFDQPRPAPQRQLTPAQRERYDILVLLKKADEWIERGFEPKPGGAWHRPDVAQPWYKEAKKLAKKAGEQDLYDFAKSRLKLIRR